jgi:hypothetical protein
VTLFLYIQWLSRNMHFDSQRKQWKFCIKWMAIKLTSNLFYFCLNTFTKSSQNPFFVKFIFEHVLIVHTRKFQCEFAYIHMVCLDPIHPNPFQSLVIVEQYMLSLHEIMGLIPSTTKKSTKILRKIILK